MFTAVMERDHDVVIRKQRQSSWKALDEVFLDEISFDVCLRLCTAKALGEASSLNVTVSLSVGNGLLLLYDVHVGLVVGLVVGASFIGRHFDANIHTDCGDCFGECQLVGRCESISDACFCPCLGEGFGDHVLVAFHEVFGSGIGVSHFSSDNSFDACFQEGFGFLVCVGITHTARFASAFDIDADSHFRVSLGNCICFGLKFLLDVGTGLRAAVRCEWLFSADLLQVVLIKHNFEEIDEVVSNFLLGL